MSDGLLITIIVVVGVAVGLWLWMRMQQPAQIGAGTGKSKQASGKNGKKATKMIVEQLKPQEYQSRFVSGGQPHTLVDVRTADEFREGHIPGAVNIELDALPRRLAEIPKDRPAVFYCRSGRRSEMAANFAAQAGYGRVANLGGIMDWQRQGLPVR